MVAMVRSLLSLVVKYFFTCGMTHKQTNTWFMAIYITPACRPSSLTGLIKYRSIKYYIYNQKKHYKGETVEYNIQHISKADGNMTYYNLLAMTQECRFFFGHCLVHILSSTFENSRHSLKSIYFAYHSMIKTLYRQLQLNWIRYFVFSYKMNNEITYELRSTTCKEQKVRNCSSRDNDWKRAIRLLKHRPT